MVRVRPDRVGALAAVALLVAPQSLMTVLTGWNESIALLPAVIWLVALSRRNRLAWLWLAIAISMKQYMVLAIPVALLMMSWRDVTRAIIVAFLIALPFVLWNFDAFWRSVVVFHFMQNFRDDALTLSAALVRTGGPELPGAVGLLCFGLILGIAWTRRLRGPTLIAATLAVGLLAFFAFNRQAFGNYYLLVAGLLLVTPLIGTKSTMTTTRTLAVNPYDPIESAVNDYQSPQRTSATAI
jgi:glucan phosphoethanolaminetransferase (alkaline phosphatase superfamily)